MDYMEVDRKAPKILAALVSAPIYKKRGRVRARPAMLGEQITTIIGGREETVSRRAVEGDWVVTNPSGEQYLISAEKFASRYRSENGVEWSARGSCRAIRNPHKVSISIMAQWGERQTGDADCMIADVCDDAGNCEGEPYLIAASAFAETYGIER